MSGSKKGLQRYIEKKIDQTGISVEKNNEAFFKAEVMTGLDILDNRQANCIPILLWMLGLM